MSRVARFNRLLQLVQLAFLAAFTIALTLAEDAVHDLTEDSDFQGYHMEQQVQYFYVKAPKIISYDYPMKISRDFGGPLNDLEPVSAQLVLAEPLNACEPLKAKSLINNQYRDRVVLAIRGDCSFMEKTLHIQEAGGFAAFIYNHEPKDEWILMAQDETNRADEVQISPYFLYHSDGKHITEALQETPGRPATIHLPMNHTRRYINHPPWRVWTDWVILECYT